MMASVLCIHVMVVGSMSKLTFHQIANDEIFTNATSSTRPPGDLWTSSSGSPRGLFQGVVPRWGLGVWQTLFMVTGPKLVKDAFAEVCGSVAADAAPDEVAPADRVAPSSRGGNLVKASNSVMSAELTKLCKDGILQ